MLAHWTRDQAHYDPSSSAAEKWFEAVRMEVLDEGGKIKSIWLWCAPETKVFSRVELDSGTLRVLSDNGTCLSQYIIGKA